MKLTCFKSVSLQTLAAAEKTFLDNLPESSTDYVLDRSIEKTYLSACSIDRLIEFVTYERGRGNANKNFRYQKSFY